MTLQVESPNSLTGKQIMAIVIQAMKDHEPTVTELAAEVAKGARAGLKTADIDIRMGPEGFNSEALDEYVSSLADFGYATKRSPLRLEQKGKSLLQGLIEKAYSTKKNEVQQWAKVLGVSVEKLLGES